MTHFNRLHAALFDELERQGAMNVDVAGLARAVARRFHLAPVDPLGLIKQPGNPRCANGACDG